MNVVVILLACVLAAVATRALQTKYFPKTVPKPKDYGEHAKFVAIYTAPLVVVSAISYVMVPVATPSPVAARRVPSVEQLKTMMKDKVVPAPVPSVTKVI